MDKMFEETVKTIRNHPRTTHNGYWNEDVFTLELNKTDCVTVFQPNNRIVYVREDKPFHYECLVWDKKDGCFLISLDETKDQIRIDPELAYFQIMTDIKEKAACKDDQEL